MARLGIFRVQRIDFGVGDQAHRLGIEISLQDDKFMSSFRAARRKLSEERGWQIDSFEAARFTGRKVLSIPSPLRRECEDLE